MGRMRDGDIRMRIKNEPQQICSGAFCANNKDGFHLWTNQNQGLRVHLLALKAEYGFYFLTLSELEISLWI